MESGASATYRFDRFVLQLARGALLAEGVECALRPKSFALLRFFVENPGRLIGRDEIMQAVWPGVFVTDDSIAQCVRDIRRALGDNEQQLLRTLPRRGYLFAAQVAGATQQFGSDAAPASAKTMQPVVDPPALSDKPSIAVLPFQNMSGDPEQEYFVDGIVEEIIVGLSRMRWLFVIARNSSFTYKGRPADVKEVGRNLGVRYVLEGSVRKAARRVRITTQLIDASTRAQLWAKRFQGDLDDIFELQDQVTASVLGELGPNLERVEIERANRKPTESLDAYDYYLRGTACAHQRTREGLAEALRLLGRAIEIDPDFAAPYGLAAFCHLIRQFNGWTSNRVQEVAEVKRLAWRAAEIGRDDAVALSFGGAALGYFAGDLENGAALIDRALSLNPNIAFAWYASGLVKSLRGEEPRLAIEEILKAIRLSPLDPFMYTIQAAMALAHFFSGDYDEASLWATRALRENPRNPGALRILAASNALAGRVEEAHQAVIRALEVDPGLRISNLEDRIGGFRPDAAAKYADALCMAGLPE